MTTTTRVRGLASWRPHGDTETLLANVKAVLTEYAEYLPLTIRQMFYRLVGAFGYPKDERAYHRLVEHMNRARRAGLIQFSAIRDDTQAIDIGDEWEDSVENTVKWWGDSRIEPNRQDGQDKRLLILCEAAGMVPQIERVASLYGVPVSGSGGFDSLTSKYDLACALRSRGMPTEAHAHRSAADRRLRSVRRAYPLVHGGGHRRHAEGHGVQHRCAVYPPKP